MTKWTWASACCRGTSHAKNSTRNQDPLAQTFQLRSDGIFAAVVSDGAGSAAMGGEGASIACRTFITSVRKWNFLADGYPTREVINEWLAIVRQRIGAAAVSRNLPTREFAATLVFAISDAQKTLIAHVGDGSIVVRDAESKEWSSISWPSQGEYASTTYFVTDEPEAQLKSLTHDVQIDAIALFSDGIERIALELKEQKAHGPFFEGMIKPIELSLADGFDKSLSENLAKYLDSALVNQRTDDDKTLILAVPRT